MKTSVLWRMAIIAAIAMVGACDLLPPEEGSGGGLGGGGGLSSFQQGFVYVRADNRDVYVADKSDYMENFARLTTSGNNKHPSLSRDGKQVVFVHGSGASAEIQTVPVSGGQPRTVVSADASMGGFSRPVFSPDGSKIAFTFERGGASFVGLVKVDGSGRVDFGNGSPALFSPTFFPDGLSLLVASTTIGATSLVKLDVTTGAQDAIVDTLGVEAMGIYNRVVLSPAGTHAAFDGQIGSGGSRIFVVNLGTRAVTQLTEYVGEPTTRDSFPSWSGSGQVAFSSDSGGSDVVYGISPNAVKQQGSVLLPSAVEAWFGPN